MGKVRLTTGDAAGGTMALNGSQLHSALNWKANQYGLSIEFRVQMSAITDVAVFVGFTDQVASLEMPINSAASADTFTENATDACGIMFDTAMATDNWWLVGAGATAQNSAIAPVAGTYETWLITFANNGAAAFFRNGRVVGTTMTSGIATASTALTPVVAAFSRGAASRNIDLDYILTNKTINHGK
jgi:hypothetical protein